MDSEYFIGCLDTVYATMLDSYMTMAEYARMEGKEDVADKIEDLAESLYNQMVLPCVRTLMCADMPELADEFVKSVKDPQIIGKSKFRLPMRKFGGTEYYASMIEDICSEISELGEQLSSDVTDNDLLRNIVEGSVSEALSKLHSLEDVVADVSEMQKSDSVTDIIKYLRSGKTMGQYRLLH